MRPRAPWLCLLLVLAPFASAHADPDPCSEDEAVARSFLVDVADEVGLGGIGNPHDPATSIHGGGLAVLDYDQDGWPDLYFVRKQPPNVLLHNEGGVFVDVTEGSGADGLGKPWVGVASGDVDADGWPDLLLLGTFGNRLLLNNGGDGTFTEATDTGLEHEGRSAIAAAFADVDADGDLDAYVANHARCLDPFLTDPPSFDEWYSEECPGTQYVCAENSLYIQTGPLQFEDRGIELGVGNDGCTLAVAASDFNGDGLIDLYSANDHGPIIEPDALYLGTGVNEHGELLPYQVHGDRLALWNMGIGVGDPDRDGDLDYYFTNTGNNKYWHQIAPGVFAESAESYGIAGESRQVVYWGVGFEDFDLDGWPDLYVVNTNDYDLMFRNTGDGQFGCVDLAPKGDDKVEQFGAVFADMDNDGDVDIVTLGMARDYDSPDADRPAVYYYRNDQKTGHHWLKVQLLATRGHPDAIGARVVLKAGGMTQMSEVSGGTSFASGTWRVRHFGLGTATQVDSLTVHWPSGQVETFTDLPIDNTFPLLLVEGEGDAAQGDDDVADDDLPDNDVSSENAQAGGPPYTMGLDLPSDSGCTHSAPGRAGAGGLLLILAALRGLSRRGR